MAPTSTELSTEQLERVATKIRRMIIEMIAARGSGHTGSSLSCVDILTVLYFRIMNVDPGNPEWPERDRFIISKGHAAPALYATLCERGYFSRETLFTLRRLGSHLQGHPDMRKTPGVDMTTGSLGQGLSAGVGMAIGLKMSGITARTFVLLGDGEQAAGQVWEAASVAAHYRLANLIAIVDMNGLQVHGRTRDVLDLGDVARKWDAFGWRVVSTDGHDVVQISRALEQATSETERPSVVLAHTVKGKGVSFMEGQVEWHGKPPSREEAVRALAELEGHTCAKTAIGE